MLESKVPIDSHVSGEKPAWLGYEWSTITSHQLPAAAAAAAGVRGLLRRPSRPSLGLLIIQLYPKENSHLVPWRELLD